MVTKSENPASPFKRAAAIWTAMTCLLALSLATLGGADATTVIAQKREGASFRKWVDAAHDIALAQVVAARRLPDADSDEKPRYEFTFETVGYVKGNTPATFRLIDQRTPDWVKLDNDIHAHDALGAFWLAFSDVDSHNGFEIDRTYLMFRGANGRLADAGGREAEPIKSSGDKWLIAVRRLVANPRERFGREGSILEMLMSSQAIVLAATPTCREFAGGNKMPGKLEIIEQLWGLDVTSAELRERGAVSIEADCEQNGSRLVIFLDEFRTVRLRVDKVTRMIDFSGLANGTNIGLIQGVGEPLWSSQVKMSGPLKWRVVDLKYALVKAARGEK